MKQFSSKTKWKLFIKKNQNKLASCLVVKQNKCLVDSVFCLVLIQLIIILCQSCYWWKLRLLTNSLICGGHVGCGNAKALVKQEWIPSTMCTVRCSSCLLGGGGGWRGYLPGGVYQQVSVQSGGVCPGVSAWGRGVYQTLPLWTEFLAHACENIAFLQL